MNLISKQDLIAAVALTTDAAAAYYNGADPIMTDADYDALIESITESVETNSEWAQIDGVDALLNAVAAGAATTGDVEHVVPMLSLAKKRELSDLESFINSVGTKMVLEPKVDGIASVVRYVDGIRTLVATRGDGQFGEDITSRIDNLRVNGLPKNLNRAVTFEVRGELYMSPDDMNFSSDNRVAAGGERFANPRNATSGTVMRETVRYEAQISFAGYEAFSSDPREPALNDDSYTVRMTAVGNLSIGLAADLLPAEVRKALAQDGLIPAVKALGMARSASLLLAATDGCVVKADSTSVRNRLGSASRHPRFAMAYKYEAIRVETQLLGIERTVGRTGNIAYTAILKKVLVDGSEVERATLHNNDFIVSNDLRIGDSVMVWKANDIIPRIESPILADRPASATPYVAPITCPQCGEELDRSSVIWRCETPSCGIVSLVAYAVARDSLDVDSFSTAIASALVEDGRVVNLSDIFYLTKSDLARLPMGMTETGALRLLGETMANKILAGLEKAKSQPLNRVICALGIRKTGRTMSRRIAAEFKTMDAVLTASENDFLRVEGVSDGKAAYIYRGVQKMSTDIERMAAAGVNMGTPAAAEATNATSKGNLPLAGKKVVVTGSVPGYSRTEAQELVELLGGIASGSVSKTTDIVVVGEGAGSKAAKAAELGIQIMDAVDFAALVK